MNAFEVIKINNNQYQIISDSKVDLRSMIFDFAVQNKLTVLHMNVEQQKLESIFQNLTK